MSVPNAAEKAVRAALTSACGRCKGRGVESWQRTSDPTAGREDWPCNRCNGAREVTDEAAVLRVLAALKALLWT